MFPEGLPELCIETSDRIGRAVLQRVSPCDGVRRLDHAGPSHRFPRPRFGHSTTDGAWLFQVQTIVIDRLQFSGLLCDVEAALHAAESNSQSESGCKGFLRHKADASQQKIQLSAMQLPDRVAIWLWIGPRLYFGN